jgi:ribosomal protein L11 methyltransferase
MAYLAYHFVVSPAQPGSEILMAMISEWPFDSFDTKENGFTAYVKQELAEGINFDDLIFEDFKYSINIEKIEASNWNEEWEKNFEPVFVDDLLCIRAPFHQKSAETKMEIVIMPKMSFGTGHHQTTRLMCREMFSLELANKRVLDMGCGTGILAILAAMLGAKQIVGIDIDEWSVENAIENCAANKFPEIEIKKGDAESLNGIGIFDVILANINKNILKAQLPYYFQISKKGTVLFLSGFFITDVEELKAVALNNNFEFRSTKNENEWAMMVLERE